MKIGLFSDSYLPSTDGISYSIESYRQELARLGHEVYVFAPAPGIRYKERSAGIVRFPAVKGLFYDDYMTSMFFPPQALQKIKKLNLDVIHFHTPSQIGLLGAYFAMRNNVPLLATYHTDLHEYVRHYPGVLPGTIMLSLLSPMVTGGSMADVRQAVSSVRPARNIDAWNQKIVRHGVTQLHNRCDIVIAPSAKIQSQLISWGAATPVKVLPTGVDKITADKQAGKLFRQQYGIAPDKQIVLFVGRLGSEKNIELLVRAFKRVLSSRPNTKLVLVGDNVHRQTLEAYIETQGVSEHTVLTGYIDHDLLGGVYAASDVFAFPSRTDTQGLVLNEAAHAGLPIVMIDSGITEVVVDGQNGFITRNSSTDMAKKLLKLLEDSSLRAQMGTASKRIARGYSVNHQTKRLIKLYEQAVSAHKKADAAMPTRRPSFIRNPFPLSGGRDDRS